MGLRQCVECGRNVSDSVSSCPACHTKTPWGVSCELCGANMRPTEGMTTKRLHVGTDPYYEDVFAHGRCITAHFSLPPSIACRDCGLAVANMGVDTTPPSLWLEWVRIDCPRCGSPDLLCKNARDWVRHHFRMSKYPLYDFQLKPNAKGDRIVSSSGSGCTLSGVVGLLLSLLLIVALRS